MRRGREIKRNKYVGELFEGLGLDHRELLHDIMIKS